MQQNLNFVDETPTWKSKQTTWTRAEARTTSRQGSEVLVAKPSQATPTLLLFLFSTTYLSTSYKQNHFPFYKHVRRGKRKNSTMKGPRNNVLKQKQKNTNTNTKVKKKRCDYRILPDYIKHQTSTRERSERSANRDIRGPRIIYTLYKRKVHQTLRNARRQKDMAYSLLPVPCLSVCLQTFCRHLCFRGNCV